MADRTNGNSNIPTCSFCGRRADEIGAQIILGIMDYFEYYYGLFVEHQDVSDFVNIYDSYLVNRGREVRVLDPKGEYTGVAEGINDRGELIVNLPGGGVQRVSSGEVSVRGIYGYV